MNYCIVIRFTTLGISWNESVHFSTKSCFYNQLIKPLETSQQKKRLQSCHARRERLKSFCGNALRRGAKMRGQQEWQSPSWLPTEPCFLPSIHHLMTACFSRELYYIFLYFIHTSNKRRFLPRTTLLTINPRDLYFSTPGIKLLQS